MPDYYPIMLDVRGRRVVIVGGDQVAAERMAAFADCGAHVTVIAPRFCERLLQLAHERMERVELLARPYQPGDLEGAFVVIATTREPALVEALTTETSARGQLLNVVDLPAACNFITPSILRRGQLTIAVSTEGASPGLAKRIRQDLEERFPPVYGSFLHLAAEARLCLREQGVTYDERDAFFRDLYASEALALLSSGAVQQAWHLTSALLRSYGVEEALLQRFAAKQPDPAEEAQRE